jgi:cephalosporin hydroxylase
VIVEDSNIGRIRKDLLPGPLEAIETFLGGTDEFEIDRTREKFLITFNPSGYLRRVR